MSVIALHCTLLQTDRETESQAITFRMNERMTGKKSRPTKQTHTEEYERNTFKMLSMEELADTQTVLALCIYICWRIHDMHNLNGVWKLPMHK